MILNGKNQLGLAFDRYMQDELFNMHYKKYIAHLTNPEIKLAAVAQIQNLFSNIDNHNYLFRNTAIDIASRIKIDKWKLEDFSFITDNLPKKKCTFLMGDKKFYRWLRWDDSSDIIVICVKLTDPDEEYKDEIKSMKEFFSGMTPEQIKQLIEKKHNDGSLSDYEYKAAMSAVVNKNFNNHLESGMFYYMWGIKNGKLSFPENEKNEDFFNEMMEFVKLLTFTELSELETVVVAPKQSAGTKKQGKVLNESNTNVTIVDSSWNKILIKGDSFRVSGHLRFQRYGENKSKVKLIYIDEFEKSGYTRNAIKETNN